MTLKLSQTSVREINSHVFAGTGLCIIDTPDGRRFRVSRVRTHNGVLEGRVINGNLHTLKDWEDIPKTASVELC